MIGRIKNWLANAKNATRQQIVSTLFQFLGTGQPMWIGDDPRDYIEQGYAQNGDLYSLVERIITFSRGVKIGLKVDGEEVERHPALDLLKCPNPLLNSFRLFQDTMIGYYLLTGNVYVYHVSADTGIRAGQPLELWVLPSQEVEVLAGDSMQPIMGYQLTYLRDPLPADKVAHIRTWNPLYDYTGQSAVYGFSPLRAGRRTVSMGNDQYAANAAIMQNGGTKGIISGKAQGEYTSEQMKDLKAKFYEQSGGSANAGKVVFTSADLQFLNLAMKSTDLDLIAGMKLTVRQLCNLYGFPSTLLNDHDASTYNNLLEMKKSAYQDCILPIMEAVMLEYLNAHIAPKFGANVEFFLDVSGIESLQQSRKDIAEMMVAAEVFTKNEIREALDYGRIDDPEFDMVYVSSNRLPISMVAITEEGIKTGEDDVNQIGNG